MNIQQLEYVIALDDHRHFVTAAEKCHVTQATLSMMVKKLEDELGVKLFDRSKKPLVPTSVGKRIISQARVIIQEASRMDEIIGSEKGVLKGELRLGVIPTLAPYVLPLFVKEFLEKYPYVKLKITEITTDEIIYKLEQGDLDAGLMAIPLGKKGLVEHHLFNEEFVVYASDNQSLLEKNYVMPSDIDHSQLWLLEEGHCMRTQVINLCELKERERDLHQLEFEAGSLKTLKKVIDIMDGMTVLPMLAMREMDERERQNVLYFKAPAPVREIGLVTYRYYVKESLVEALKEVIIANVPLEIPQGSLAAPPMVMRP
jgi:LysR family hydrogen peroxide-inducible transcriptional activator